MYDLPNSASSENQQTSQSQAPHRTIGPPGLVQASSSSAQLGYQNGYIENSPAQPHSNALAFPTRLNRAPYNQQPENKVDIGSPYDNSLGARRPSNLVGAYHSSYTPKAPLDSHQSYFPVPYAQSSVCFVSQGIECYCQSCLPIPDQIPHESDNHIPPRSITIHQPYGVGSEGDTSTISFQNSINSPFNLPQPPSLPPYNQTGVSNSQFDSSSYLSMGASYGHSSAQPNSSSIQYPSDSFVTGPPSIDQSFQSHLSDMRFYTPAQKRPQLLDVKDPSRFSSSLPKSIDLNVEPGSCDIGLDCTQFLKAQGYLDLELRNGELPPLELKQKLASLLKMSLRQLNVCVDARLELLPILKDLAIQSANLGIPTNHVAGWFSQVQSSQSASRNLYDSAYHSNSKPIDDHVKPSKKRRRTVRDDERHKKFQCTAVKPDCTYCLKETDNMSDWKRHEEIHWPQRRWECLISGSNATASCHICGRRIDLLGQQPSTSHDQCIGEVFRNSHDFHRKDKLIKHVLSAHGCNVNVDSWYRTVRSDWKRQCGFCGSMFSGWDARCDHVSQHFTAGKRMVPDWRDPWPSDEDSDDQPPDDGDGDNGNGNGHEDSYDTESYDPRPDYGPNDAARKSGGPSGHFAGNNGSQDEESQHDIEILYLNDSHRNEEDDRQKEGPDLCGMIQDETSCLSPPETQSSHGIFTFVRKLGYGAFGTVDEVLHNSTKKHFARKSIRVTLQHSLPVLVQARREVVALCNLRHAHIISVVASYALEDQFSIIMSPVAEWNLSEYMLNDRSATLTKVTRLSKWIPCLISAVSYIHDKSWQHLDIKPTNVLVAGETIMLSDFGGALATDRYHPQGSVSNNCAITPMYCAPEMVGRCGKLIVPGASDIYSLGCVFLEMATVIYRESPISFHDIRAYGGRDASYHSNTWKSWTWINYLWDIDEALGFSRQHGLQIIASMLADDPRKRPTARYIQDSYHSYHLFHQSHKTRKIEEQKYFIITTNSRDQFDPLEIARRWFTNCSINHKGCSSDAKDFFPSRILNVGTDSDFIHLQSPDDSSSPYVTLSHCWGAGNILKTTSQTLRKMTMGIAISSLSNTFSDAVQITRALGIKYLWIDSLCILQDCVDDWVSESSQMAKIYSHSSLTICLANDENAMPVDRQILAETSNNSDPNRMCSTCAHGHSEFEPLWNDTATTMLFDSPLSKRGWTLQERILSPRVLYWSSTRMAFECGSNRLTLDIVSRMRESLKMLSIKKTNLAGSRKRRRDSTISSPSQHFTKFWRDVVKEYSKRQLSFSNDKLPALAGVSAEIGRLSGQRYLAGLWENDLAHSLLWCRDFATIPLPPPVEYRAPSWSWASIDSPVIWSKSVLEMPGEAEAKVVRCNVTPKSKICPYGEVVSGYLQIKGTIQRVLVERARPNDVFNAASSTPFAFAQWDALNRHDIGAHQDGKNVTDDLWCLQILGSAGLLLREMKTPDTFQRVGVYWVQESWVEESDLARHRQGEFRTITIL